MDVTLEQEGVSDENMCNGHDTHSLTCVLSRQRGTRRVTVQHLRDDTMYVVSVVGQRCNGGSRGTDRVTRVTVVTRGSHVCPRLSSV